MEARFAPAGLTIIVHGFEQSSESDFAWEAAMKDQIVTAAGGLNQVAVGDVKVSAASSWSGLFYNDTNIAFSGNIVVPQGPGQVFNGEVVLAVDWRSLADSLVHSATTGEVAEALYGYLFTATYDGGHSLLELPIDLIGHSRGASLVLALAKDLGQIGAWVDQVTTLDPHPAVSANGWDYGYVPGLSDPNSLEPTSNVVFADNYYETVNPIHGQAATGAVNNGATSGNGTPLYLPGGYSSCDGGDHADVHLWYQGTIGVAGNYPTNDGTTSTDCFSSTYSPQIWTGWYSSPNPSQTTSGFDYSRIMGGTYDGGTRPDVGLLSAFNRIPVTSLNGSSGNFMGGHEVKFAKMEEDAAAIMREILKASCVAF